MAYGAQDSLAYCRWASTPFATLRKRTLRENVLDNVPMHVGQTLLDPVVVESRLRVIESEEVEPSAALASWP